MKPAIITISRQFGSGGREIAAALSQRLGIPCYEKALLEQASQSSGIHRIFFEQAEEHRDYLFANLSGSFGPLNLSLDDRMYLAQAKTIRELAEQSPCIIVGRGANHILKDRDDVLSLFLCAPKDMRLKRIVEVYGVPAERAEAALRAVDKNRAAYLKHYTGQVFGSWEDHHLCMDSGKLGLQNAVKIVEGIYRTLE
jgi:cytidylate kinase